MRHESKCLLTLFILVALVISTCLVIGFATAAPDPQPKAATVTHTDFYSEDVLVASIVGEGSMVGDDGPYHKIIYFSDGTHLVWDGKSAIMYPGEQK